MIKVSLRYDPDMNRLEDIFRKLPPGRQDKLIDELERGKRMEGESYGDEQEDSTDR